MKNARLCEFNLGPYLQLNEFETKLEESYSKESSSKVKLKLSLALIQFWSSFEECWHAYSYLRSCYLEYFLLRLNFRLA